MTLPLVFPLAFEALIAAVKLTPPPTMHNGTVSVGILEKFGDRFLINIVNWCNGRIQISLIALFPCSVQRQLPFPT
jgi:hypothetical protein